MKKIFKVSAVILVLAVLVSAFAGCALMPQKKQLIGTWVVPNSTLSFDFKDDGTVKFTLISTGINLGNTELGTIDGTYTTSKQDGKNIITISYKVVVNLTLVYQYEVNGNTLTITDIESGKATQYTRTA